MADVPEEKIGTHFADIYNCFLGKITDDMYMVLTPQDTIKDLQNLLLDVIPAFEFPRFNIEGYNISLKTIREDEVEDGDFILAILWGDLPEETGETQAPMALIDCSSFEDTLTAEEINILALLMKQAWVQRQVTSIENIRMKYSGSDFKMTSQANHLSKLLQLLDESRRDQFHHQRLYGRRIKNDEGRYESNWKVLNSYGKNRWRFR